MLSKLLVVCTALFLLSPAARSQGRLDGEWVGGTNVLGNWRFTQARFIGSGSQLSGSIDVPTANAMREPLSGNITANDAVLFSVESPLGTMRFDGAIRNGIIEGHIVGPGGLAGELHLVRATPIDLALYKHYVGTYRLSDQTTLVVTFRPFGQLFATQTEELNGKTAIRRTFNLVPQDSSTFFTSGSVNAAPKRDETVRFTGETDKDAASLDWRASGATLVTGNRQDEMRQEWAVFHNGDITLNGTLLFPMGTGPYPAVVSVGGSGPTTRDAVIMRARELVRAGLAVLIYDKRGTGDPSGNWGTATPLELASDARAAMTFLRGRQDVDPKRLGYHGHSQGGWIVPIALSSDSSAAFAILTSSTPQPPAEQEAYRAGAQARTAKLGEKEAADSAALMKLKWKYGLSGEGWEEYAAAARSAQGKAWLSIVNPPMDRASPLWQDISAFRGFDPLSYDTAVRIPILLLFGADDDEVSPREAASAWRAALTTARHHDVTISEIPHVGHSIFFQTVNNRSVILESGREQIADWLRQHTYISR